MVGVTSDIFIHLGLVITIAAIAAFILRMIKQPQLLAYVLVGILITPVFGLVTDTSVIESMSAIGIAFLLFLVGLEMDVKKLKSVALVSSLGGLIQIIALFIGGYLVAILLGFLSLEAAYVGLILAFSSTMVVMKLLSDKRELSTLHGRIVIGILLMQDIVAIFALSILTSIDSNLSFSLIGLSVLRFLSLFVAAYLASKYLFPKMFRFAAKNQELLLITSLAICFTFSLAFYKLGFSIAIGAFLAGIALGNLEYSIEIAGKIKNLRDFFALLFFVSLGMTLSLTAIKDLWLSMLIILLVVLLFKPLVIMLICSIFKYTKKPSFLTAISLAQIGEFSLILVAQGKLLGHISEEIFSLTVVVALISITATTYFIKYDHWFYKIMQKPLKIFDVFTTEGLEYLPTENKPKIVLCGHNRIGYSILKGFRSRKKSILIVDYNPEIINSMVDKGYHCIYGNVTDQEIIEKMNLKHIKMLISTVPELKDNILLLRKTREVNKKAKIYVTANEIEDALRLYKKGADYVILPHFLGGEHVANIITLERKRKIKLKEEKEDHIKHLTQRKKMGHEHPDT